MDLAVLDFLIPLNTDYLHWGYLGRFDSGRSHQTTFNKRPQFLRGPFRKLNQNFSNHFELLLE
jgi:hypothetical protein